MEDSLKKDMTTLLYMRMDALSAAKSEDEKKAIFRNSEYIITRLKAAR